MACISNPICGCVFGYAQKLGTIALSNAIDNGGCGGGGGNNYSGGGGDNNDSSCSSDDDDNCDTPLSKGEIEKLKKFLGGSEELHKEKEGYGGPPKYFDFYKCRNGDIVIKRKGGGPVIARTGLNINQI